MKESYVEGLAGRNDPESGGDAREGADEALTGERAGRVFSREKDIPPRCRRRKGTRKAKPTMPLSQGMAGPRAVADPVHARKHLAREPGDPMFTGPDGRAGRVGKSKDTRR